MIKIEPEMTSDNAIRYRCTSDGTIAEWVDAITATGMGRWAWSVEPAKDKDATSNEQLARAARRNVAAKGRMDMKTIWKFGLALDDIVELAMPRYARLLTVQMQRGIPHLWAVVDTDQPVVKRRFRVFGTGHQMDLDHSNYIGTFQINGGSLVFHLFEALASNANELTAIADLLPAAREDSRDSGDGEGDGA